ncbi:MAG TPA: hypothetical protein VMF50_14085 [Candidatus Binataceae bacterium]|nr:hypothetical protein [Candidatus Binataceae bacterium]
MSDPNQCPNLLISRYRRFEVCFSFVEAAHQLRNLTQFMAN